MRRAVLVALLLVAGCGGDDPSAERATLVIDVNVRGKQSFETFVLADGRLTPGKLTAPRVYARAGNEPDRQSIAFEEIYLVEPGKEPRRLTSDRRFDHSPSLLRDGSVAFVSCPISAETGLPACSLVAVEPESGERRTIAGELGFVWNADLAPDEERILLSRAGENFDASDLFVRSLDSGDEVMLGDAAFGRWSPDGERILFTSDRARNGRCLFHDCTGFANEVYVMDADGTDVRRLTENPAHDGKAEWSGDGEWIVFGRIPDENADWDLYAVRADGECEVQLTDTERWETPAEWHGPGHGGLSC